MNPTRRAVPILAALVAALALGAPAASANGAAALVEKEFAAAIKKVTPATVFLKAKQELGPSGGSSGVIISKNGYVLSDGDAGAYFRPVKGPDGKVVLGEGNRPRMELVRADEAEVRLPDLRRGTYEVFTAKVVKRVLEIDSSLLKIEAPAGRTFPFVLPGDSDPLDVGHFTFAMGMAFGNGDEGSAALTAGVVAALLPQPQGAPGGNWAEVYTSAAVNPGVNGGPLVDVEGSLVGVISTWGQPEPQNPFQFLGKAFPITRIRHAYADVAGAAAIFPDPKSLPPRSRQAGLLEAAFADVAHRARTAVVTIETKREKPFALKAPGPGGLVDLPRYQGPFSGVVVSKDGWVVTSLYNLADVTPLAYLQFGMPNQIAPTVRAVKEVTVRFADGTVAPARIAGHDESTGLAVLKADLPAGYEARPLEPAATDQYVQGRLVVCVAAPFLPDATPLPLVTIGMISRQHPGATEFAWQGSLQTDAGLTDGTCGGALVDLHGRLLGVAALWNPGGHGRNSGIGFGLPWERVAAALPSLQQGKSRVFDGFLGIGTKLEDGGVLRVTSVSAQSPAASAGIREGDVVVALDGKDVLREVDVVLTLRRKSAGDPVRIVVERGGKRVEIAATMGRRPAPPGESASPSEPAPAPDAPQPPPTPGAPAPPEPKPDAPSPQAPPPDAPRPDAPQPDAPAKP